MLDRSNVGEAITKFQEWVSKNLSALFDMEMQASLEAPDAEHAQLARAVDVCWFAMAENAMAAPQLEVQEIGSLRWHARGQRKVLLLKAEPLQEWMHDSGLVKSSKEASFSYHDGTYSTTSAAMAWLSTTNIQELRSYLAAKPHGSGDGDSDAGPKASFCDSQQHDMPSHTSLNQQVLCCKLNRKTQLSIHIM